MECHDCSKSLFFKFDPDWLNEYDSAYFSPGLLDKYIRCLRCWRLALDEKKIPHVALRSEDFPIRGMPDTEERELKENG
jgi:hypothetical protein